MELTPLKYFIKLSETLSFTAAAKELFITQSTLSLSIKQLEEELGIPLFDRIGKKVYLTDAGTTFLAYARRATEEADCGVQHLKEMQQQYRGKLKIGVIYSLFPLLNACVQKFVRAFPCAELSIVYSHSVKELTELIDNNQLDFALNYVPENVSPRTEVTEYAKFPLCVIACTSHPLAIRKHISLSDMNGFPLILASKDMYTRQVADRMLSRYKVKIRPQVEVNSMPLLLNMLRSGLWISILPQDVTINNPQLKTIAIKEKTEMMHVCLLSLKGKRRSILTEKFLEVIRDEIREIESGQMFLQRRNLDS